MKMLRSLSVVALAVGLSGAAGAQPINSPEQAARTVSPYLYLMDSQGNRVLLSTQFWRNDVKYDDRAFHRFLDVVSGLEKRGFHRDDKAVIDDWDKAEPFARCYIYMEDLQAGSSKKGTITTGSRTWCSDNGISEHAIRPSDTPEHAQQVLRFFVEYFDRAKKNLHERTLAAPAGKQ